MKTTLEKHIVTVMAVLVTVIFWRPLNKAVMVCVVPVVSMIPDGSWVVQAAMILAVAVLYAVSWRRLRDEAAAMPIRRWGLAALILLHVAGRLSGCYVFYGVDNCPLCYLDICYIGIVSAETVAFIRNRVRRKNLGKSATGHGCFPFHPEQPSSDNSFDRKRLADILADKIMASYREGAFSGGSFTILLNEKFGAGKTSFFKLFKGVAAEKNIVCLEFLPWLPDSDKSQADRFFMVLENHIKLSGDYYLLSLLRSYSSSVSEVPVNSLMNRLFQFVFRRNPLEQTYSAIFSRLKQLESPIIVLVDDVDRLNADEIVSMLKLLRNTANFPNLVFLVAADRTQMENMLGNSGLAAPGEFLKKFFNFELLFPAVDDEILPAMKTGIRDILDFYYPGKDNASAVEHVFRNLYMNVVFHNFRDVSRFLNLLSFSFDSLKQSALLSDISVSDMINITLLQFADSHIFRILRDDHSLLLELGGIPGTGRLKIRSSVSSLLTDSHTREILKIATEKKSSPSVDAGEKPEEAQSLKEYHDSIDRNRPTVMDFTAWILRDIFDSSRAELNSVRYINEYFKYFAGKYRRNELSDSEMAVLMQSPDPDFRKRAESLSAEGRNDFLFHKLFVYSQHSARPDWVNIISKLLILFDIYFVQRSSQLYPFLTRRVTWMNSYYSHSVSNLLRWIPEQKPDSVQTEELEAFFLSDTRFTELGMILHEITSRDDERSVVKPEKLRLWKRSLIDRFISEVLESGPFREENIDIMVCLDDMEPEYWAEKFGEHMKKPGMARIWLDEMFSLQNGNVYALKNRYKFYFDQAFIPEWLTGALQSVIPCTLAYKVV